MKKILFVMPLIAKYDAEFFQAFVKNSNYKVYVAANIKIKNQLAFQNYDEYNIKALHIDIRKIGPFDITFGLSQVISNINPEFIIYSASPRDLGQMVSIIKSKLTGRKFAIWSMFHRIGGPRLYSTLYYKFLGRIAHRNMTYSRIGKLYQVSRGVDTKKVDIIETAIDEKKVFQVIENMSMNNYEKFVKEIVTIYGLQDTFILLQVVRLNAIKKPFFLIDMMKLLIKKENNFRLFLIGGGDLEEEVKKYVIKLGLEKYVIFLGPIYDEEILSYWFKFSHVFVIPTCIGLSTHHACCYGLPIVTDDSVINQASEFDILQDGLNCLLYKEDSLELFVDSIYKLKNDQDFYNEISKNAILTVKNKYTLKNKTLNMKQSINKVLEND